MLIKQALLLNKPRLIFMLNNLYINVNTQGYKQISYPQ